MPESPETDIIFTLYSTFTSKNNPLNVAPNAGYGLVSMAPVQ